jgi:hypothetical protein
MEIRFIEKHGDQKKKREMEKNDGRSMMANKKDAGTGRTLCNNGIAAGGRTEDSSPSTIIGR